MPNLKAVLQQLQSQRADLEREISRLDLALSAPLGSFDGRRSRHGGRRNLSAAARNLIEAAQKKRV
jgi:hypothetical protein